MRVTFLPVLIHFFCCYQRYFFACYEDFATCGDGFTNVFAAWLCKSKRKTSKTHDLEAKTTRKQRGDRQKTINTGEKNTYLPAKNKH
jgi:hypothetical protein